jgi:aspartate 1-decarboxylase
MEIMLRRFLNAKIRDIRITSVNLEYQGSIMLDEDYLEASGILPNEEVHVLDIENGERITTYALRGKRGSGIVELNGPAARCGLPGDRVMVLSYCSLSEDEIPNHKPRIVSVSPPAKAKSRTRRASRR